MTIMQHIQKHNGHAIYVNRKVIFDLMDFICFHGYLPQKRYFKNTVISFQKVLLV